MKKKTGKPAAVVFQSKKRLLALKANENDGGGPKKRCKIQKAEAEYNEDENPKLASKPAKTLFRRIDYISGLK